ncbi:MAG TPA: hypothetical protein VM889_14940 [Candidatus Thermoplasmatota archaeon]|nr:hypothetical protein [Candidatus Thermoplasmatota archaeon]
MGLYLVRALVKPGAEEPFRAWVDDPEAATPGFETDLQAAIRAGHFSGPRVYFTVESPRGDPRELVADILGDWLTLQSSVPVHEVSHGDFERD